MLLSLSFLLSPLVRSAVLDTRQTPGDDCFRAMRLVDPSQDNIINGQAAQDCLLSLPFDKKKGRQFLTEIKKYVQFQSTLEVLQDPPDTYLSPAVDILGGLDQIGNTQYNNQYQFDFDLRNLIRSATDGHFFIFPCSLAAFTFYRQETGRLASISQDGIAQPEIYLGVDVAAISSGNTTISPVTKINGQDVIEYLETVAALQGSQDPDARWNTLFASAAAIATGNTDVGSLFGQFAFNDGLWPGVNSTTLEFKNGKTLTFPTLSQYNFRDIYPSSAELYDAACIPSVSDNARRAVPTKRDDNSQVRPPLTAGPTSFPTPFIREPYNQISGYILDNDTAVMFIPTFVTDSSLPANQDRIFGQFAEKLVNRAIAQGRTKLIIDLSRNGGGSTLRAFDLFKLFFPSKFPYSANRFRRHDALDLIALSTQKVPLVPNGLNPFDYQQAVNATQDGGFASAEEFLEGETQFGGNVTAISANFNITLLSTENADNGPVRGFGGARINNTQPYAPEDIIIVTDGVCASTCAIFVNLMTQVGGVRTLTFGGRPRSEPMQVIGGVRGSQSYTWPEISRDVLIAKDHVHNDPSLFTDEQLALAAAVWPKPLEDLPLFLSEGGVNLRNAYQEGADHLPLHFDYQASDCRLFYTAKNLVDPASSWADAKAAIWGDRGCVPNSTGGRGSLTDRNRNNTSGDGENGSNNSSDSDGDSNNENGSNNDDGGDNSGNSSSSSGNGGGNGGDKDDKDNGAGSLHLRGTLIALGILASAFTIIL
ncbi:hypothetical protein GQX73_g5364 [Xylaria multiplex]|uniref:Uncharacterized protein n=1 Tax=Xylaria multiplex TaxID=323545 RepID=A0A7C8MTU5_9PEZI|nr:hypothetical protein GQX73_g5364 [Xylaria multiplex]